MIIVEFVLTTLLVYLLYYIFMISKYDKNGRLKKNREKSLLNRILIKIRVFLFNYKPEKEETLKRGRKPRKIKNDNIKIPTEVEILIIKYHIDLSKINYKKLLKIVGLTCAIDISIIISIISIVPTDNIYLSVLVGALLVIPVILISYSIIGNYFKKKGLVIKDGKKNATNKRNRK